MNVRQKVDGGFVPSAAQPAHEADLLIECPLVTVLVFVAFKAKFGHTAKLAGGLYAVR